MRPDVMVAGVSGLAALGAAGLTVALAGLGVPFFLGALAASCCAAAVTFATCRWAYRPAPPDPLPLARIRQLEALGSALRHDLRGVLSPALMMSDRLLQNDDPKVRRAGEAVVKSIERATALLADNKLNEAATGSAPPVPQAQQAG